MQIPFQNGLFIKGNLHVNEKSTTLLILCHGFNDSKDIYEIKRMAKLLEKNFNVFRFTFTDEEPDLSIEAENLSVVVKYFSSQYKTIVVVGHSLGGLAVILSSINNQLINKLILINPFIYLLQWVAWRFRKILILMTLMYPFSKRVRTNFLFYFKTLKPKFIKIPSLIIIGSKDKIVSPNHGKTFYNEIMSKEKKLIIDRMINHGFTKESYIKRITDYIVSWLK